MAHEMRSIRIYDNCVIKIVHDKHGELLQMAGSTQNSMIPRVGEIIEIADDGAYVVTEVGYEFGDGLRQRVMIMVADV